MLVAASHLIIGLVGTVLLYVALFLRETETGKLQNRLEKLWVDIDDLSKAALSRQTAFLQRVSAMANTILNKIFGTRLFSAEAMSASLCFSLSSFLLFVVGMRHYFGFQFEPQMGRPLFLAIGIVSLVVGLFPIPFRYLGFPWTFGFILFAIYTDWKFWRGRAGQAAWHTWEDFLTNKCLPFFFILIGGFVCDVLFIAVSRWCLRKSSELNNGWKIVSLLTLNGSLGVILISPVILPFTEYEIIDTDYYPWLLFLGSSNGVAGAIALLFVALAFTALAHLAIWPILERPIYSLQRFGVAGNPKLLAAASVACLLFAWPNSPIIQAITKLVHG